MKIIRFATTDSAPAGFGVVVRNYAVSFAALDKLGRRPKKRQHDFKLHEDRSRRSG